MAKSQQAFNKIEKEKLKQKKREEKKKKKEARKAESKDGKGGIQFAYVDQFGNLTDTPPDPTEREEIDIESIEIGIPKQLESDKEEIDPVRKGKVSFFDNSKGFGFIIDSDSQEKHFCHISGLIDKIQENDKVSFELERGMKGMNAVRVKLI
ncbi:MAG: DNA-binding protein [Bacteroidetes bacterium MedPE-SWsnd-G2]|nr:MAG: DNA-binding protein [Bacteroidetes bacterium MedPE-SWsnd-G2]